MLEALKGDEGGVGPPGDGQADPAILVGGQGIDQVGRQLRLARQLAPGVAIRAGDQQLQAVGTAVAGVGDPLGACGPSGVVPRHVGALRHHVIDLIVLTPARTRPRTGRSHAGHDHHRTRSPHPR